MMMTSAEQALMAFISKKYYLLFTTKKIYFYQA
jgi:hypothetical protein